MEAFSPGLPNLGVGGERIGQAVPGCPSTSGTAEGVRHPRKKGRRAGRGEPQGRGGAIAAGVGAGCAQGPGTGTQAHT